MVTGEGNQQQKWESTEDGFTRWNLLSAYLPPSLSPCLSPSLSNLDLEKSTHTHAVEGRKKNKKKHKFNCIKGSMPGSEIWRGTRRCKWSRGSKQQSNIENKRTKGKTESAVCEKEKYSQLEKHPSLLQITAVGKLCYQPSWSGRFHILKQQDYLAKVGFLKSQ